jgi:hypothetical protein
MTERSIILLCAVAVLVGIATVFIVWIAQAALG